MTEIKGEYNAEVGLYKQTKVKNESTKLIQIGQTELRDQPLFLAPMEDVTDPSFRYICKQYGADFVYTEFISSDGLIRNGRKSVKKLNIFEYERPIGIQLYGHLIEPMVEAARIATLSKPDIIDLNFGCPVRKIAQRGAGAGMLRNIPLMIEMTDAIVKSTNIPVTVKTRLGWDDDSKNIKEIALMLQDVGIQGLTIHGRTRNQMYKGRADWTLIGEVKNDPAIHIPIIQMMQASIPDADIYHAISTGYAGLLGAIAKARINRPFLLTEHGIYAKEREIEINQSETFKGYQKRMWKKSYHGLAHIAYQYADSIISLFKRNRDIQIQLGAPAEKCQVIPNGIHIKDFKNRLRFHKSTHVILYLKEQIAVLRHQMASRW
jgi:nifR3 family TIM-barrel protein